MDISAPPSRAAREVELEPAFARRDHAYEPGRRRGGVAFPAPYASAGPYPFLELGASGHDWAHETCAAASRALATASRRAASMAFASPDKK